jgi:hypothetical protein
MIFYVPVGKHKGMELVLFNKLLGNHQKNIFCFDCYYIPRGDHAPHFNILMIVWNMTIIEFSFYDLRHNDEKYYEL